jgi:hypothetical protein
MTEKIAIHLRSILNHVGAMLMKTHVRREIAANVMFTGNIQIAAGLRTL